MRRIVIGACGLVLLLAARLAVDRICGAGLVDDAYIFLRYAEHSARGDGLVFNAGDRVEGYSSPLWMAMLAVAARLPWDPPTSARWLSTSLGLLSLLVLAGCGSRLMARPADRLLLGAGALGLALDPCSAFWAGSGMETALTSCLVLTTMLAFQRAADLHGPMWLAGLALALVCLARPEGLALAPALWLCCPPGRRLGLFAPMALPALHLIWRYSYYGDWLPNTYHAKAGVPLAPLASAGARYVGGFELAFAPLLIALAAAALALRGRGALSTGAWRAPFLGVVLWIGAVVLEGGDHFPLFRFLAPIVPLLIWLLVLLAGSLGRGAPSRFSLAAPALVVVLLAAQAGALLAWHGGAKAAQEAALAESWAEVGRWLRANVPADMTLAATVVGAIPYYSRLTTVDLLGLTDREIARHGQVASEAVIGHQKHHTDYVLRRRPDVIVYRSSGWAARPSPLGQVPAGPAYDYALVSLVTDPRTDRLYAPLAYPMPNGRYVEFLALKSSRPRLPPMP